MALKWLTNDFDPNHKLAKANLRIQPGEDRNQTWKEYQEWLKDKIIGDPQATTECGVVELKQEGMVGIYAYRQ